MTIDAENFAPQGKPTREQVKEVWDAMPKASARKVAELLVNRGFDISWRTVSRWHAHDWVEVTRSAPNADQGKPKAVKRLIRGELGKVSAVTVKDANEISSAGGLDGAITGGKLTEDDYTRIEKLRAMLMGKTEVELDQMQSKARKVFNIILLQEAAARAHVLALIPKDSGALVQAMTEAATVGLLGEIIGPTTVPDGKGNGDDAKLINGTATDVTPLSDAIRRVRERAA